MNQKISPEVLSVLPYFNDNIVLILADKENHEYEMLIHEKSNTGNILLNQCNNHFDKSFVNEKVDILYTTKFKSVGQKVSGQITKLNKSYVLVTLHGLPEDIPDRRMDKRFNVNDNIIQFNIFKKKRKFKYKIDPVNISNTGLRFSYERCNDCNDKDTCSNHLETGDILEIELDFKPLKSIIRVEGQITSADQKHEGSETFFAGVKFNCDPGVINKISRNIREIEAFEIQKRYKAKMDEESLISGKED